MFNEGTEDKVVSKIFIWFSSGKFTTSYQTGIKKKKGKSDYDQKSQVQI